MYSALKIKLDECGIAPTPPTRAHDTDAGLDLYSPIDFFVKPGGRFCVYTGVHIELPPHTYGAIKSKSGLMLSHGIVVDGTIDEGYRGQIGVVVFNLSRNQVEFKKGDKIAQLVVCPVEYPDVKIVDELSNSSRGTGGFGSTGR